MSRVLKTKEDIKELEYINQVIFGPTSCYYNSQNLTPIMFHLRKASLEAKVGAHLLKRHLQQPRPLYRWLFFPDFMEDLEREDQWDQWRQLTLHGGLYTSIQSSYGQCLKRIGRNDTFACDAQWLPYAHQTTVTIHQHLDRLH